MMPFRPSSLWLPSCRSLLQECAPGCPHRSSDPTLSLSLFPRQHPSSFSLCLSPTQKHTLPITSLSLSLSAALPLAHSLSFPTLFRPADRSGASPFAGYMCSALLFLPRHRFLMFSPLCSQPSLATPTGAASKSTRRQEHGKLRALSMHVCLQTSLHCLPFYNLRHLASTLWSAVTITSE